MPDTTPGRVPPVVTRTKLYAVKQIKPQAILRRHFDNTVLKSVKLANNKLKIDTTQPGLIDNLDGTYSGNVKIELETANVYTNVDVDNKLNNLSGGEVSMGSSMTNSLYYNSYNDSMLYYFGDPVVSKGITVTNIPASVSNVNNVLTVTSTAYGDCRLSVPNFLAGTKDFTFEYMFLAKNMVGSQEMASLCIGDGTNSLLWLGNRNVALYYYSINLSIISSVAAKNGSYEKTGSLSLIVDTWYKFTMIRKSGIIYAYLNGTLITQFPAASSTYSLYTASNLYIYPFYIPGLSSYGAPIGASIKNIAVYDKAIFDPVKYNDGFLKADIIPIVTLKANYTNEIYMISLADKYTNINASVGTISLDSNRVLKWTIPLSAAGTTQTLTIDGNTYNFTVV